MEYGGASLSKLTEHITQSQNSRSGHTMEDLVLIGNELGLMMGAGSATWGSTAAFRSQLMVFPGRLLSIIIKMICEK